MTLEDGELPVDIRPQRSLFRRRAKGELSLTELAGDLVDEQPHTPEALAQGEQEQVELMFGSIMDEVERSGLIPPDGHPERLSRRIELDDQSYPALTLRWNHLPEHYREGNSQEHSLILVWDKQKNQALLLTGAISPLSPSIVNYRERIVLDDKKEWISKLKSTIERISQQQPEAFGRYRVDMSVKTVVPDRLALAIKTVFSQRKPKSSR